VKAWQGFVVSCALIALSVPSWGVSPEKAPKYDLSSEATFKGSVVEVRDRTCAVTGGMGSHIILKLADGKNIEVHIAPTEFMKRFEIILTKGEAIEVVGSKVKFEGVDTVLAREIWREDELLIFRDNEGNHNIW
jgi:DNA/RNA endonuclease YhcR with UshA esterase domain